MPDNQKLSGARAQAVKAYLVSKGIERTAFTPKARAKQPVADNKSQKVAPNNRRVENRVVGTRYQVIFKVALKKSPGDGAFSFLHLSRSTIITITDSINLDTAEPGKIFKPCASLVGSRQ